MKTTMTPLTELPKKRFLGMGSPKWYGETLRNRHLIMGAVDNARDHKLATDEIKVSRTRETAEVKEEMDAFVANWLERVAKYENELKAA